MIRVTFGEHDRCNETVRPETRFVLRAFVQDFSFTNFDKDIAILRLNDRVPITDFIRPICLPNDEGECYLIIIILSLCCQCLININCYGLIFGDQQACDLFLKLSLMQKSFWPRLDRWLAHSLKIDSMHNNYSPCQVFGPWIELKKALWVVNHTWNSYMAWIQAPAEEVFLRRITNAKELSGRIAIIIYSKIRTSRLLGCLSSSSSLFKYHYTRCGI